MAANKPGQASTPKSENGNASEDTIPELKVFQNHFTGLTNMLFNTNLTPYLIEEGVVALTDQEELDALPTSFKKASFVLPKITSALKTGETKPFYKTLEIMKCHGNHAAQQLSDTIASEIPEPRREQLQSVTIKKLDELSLEFSALIADVAELLEKSASLNKFKLVCCHITTTESSPVFSEKEISQIHASSSVFDIFFQLRNHWRWDNHRLLYTLIKRTGSQEAMDRLKQFRSKVDYTKKLNKLSEYFQSVRTLPPTGYTTMRAIIDKDYSEFTVKDCTEIDKYLAFAFGSATLNPADYEPSTSILVTWYIPTEAVSGLLCKAYQAKETFQLLSISFFEIDEVVVWNKKWPYSLQALREREEEIGKAKQEVAELTEKIDQCNLDLKTAHDDLAVKENEKKELEENLKKVKDEADKVPKLQEQIKELSTKVTQMEDNEKTLDEEVKKYKSECEEKKKEVNELHENLKAMKASRDECRKECDAKNAEMSDVMRKAKEHIDSIQQDLDRITAERDKLEKEYSALQKNNTGAQTSKDDLIKELETKNTELSSGRDKDKKQLDDMQQNLEKVTADKNKLESELARVKQINVEMKFNEEKLTMEIEKKDEELSRIQGEQLQEQLKAKQLDNLPTDIKPAQRNIIQSLRQKNRDFMEQITSLESKNKDFTEQITSFQSRNDSLIKERKELLNQIEFLRHPKAYDPGIGPLVPGSRRTTGEIGLDSGIEMSRPNTSEQQYIPKDK